MGDGHEQAVNVDHEGLHSDDLSDVSPDSRIDQSGIMVDQQSQLDGDIFPKMDTFESEGSDSNSIDNGNSPDIPIADHRDTVDIDTNTRNTNDGKVEVDILHVDAHIMLTDSNSNSSLSAIEDYEASPIPTRSDEA